MAGTAVLALSLAACGSDDSSSPEATDTNTPSESSSAPGARVERPGRRNLHQRQVQGQPDQREQPARRRHPAPDRQPCLPRPAGGSGVGLAVSEINAAGVGITACHNIQDSGDSTDMSISSASAQTLIASKPSVVIGAASSSVSLNVVDSFADNKIVEISPANTAVDLSGYSPWYFRTAPPDDDPGQRPRHADLVRRLPEDRVPGLQRHLRHRSSRRGRRRRSRAPAASASTAARATATSSPPARPRSRPRSAPRWRPTPTRS